MTLKIEKFQIGKEAGYLLNIYFDTAAGLAKNAPVRVAGVPVGSVEKVLLDKGKAKVTFHLPYKITIYKDAKAYLKSEGFLGEKYIEITPGTPGNPKVEPEWGGRTGITSCRCRAVSIQYERCSRGSQRGHQTLGRCIEVYGS